MLRELQDRRRALVVRSAFQRLRISAQLAPTARRLAAADRVVATLRAHPVAAGIALTGLALIGPRRLFRWAMRIAPIYSLLVRI
jgi:hypothetical protein